MMRIDYFYLHALGFYEPEFSKTVNEAKSHEEILSLCLPRGSSLHY